MPDITKLLDMSWEHIVDALLLPALILIIALTVGILLNREINRRIQRHLDTNESSWQSVFVHALKGVPISWCLAVGLYWIIKTIDFSPATKQFFSYVLFTVIVYTIVRVVSRALNAIIEVSTQKSGTAFPKSSLLSTIVNVIIHAMGILVILQYMGISVAPILTAMGVGGMALALGLQETLANIFSGLQLILSKQIHIGDYVRLSSGEEGRATDINFRFTVVQTLGGNSIIIPNKILAAAVLTNYSVPAQEVSVSVEIGVSYDSDLKKVEHVTVEVAREVMEHYGHDTGSKPLVRFHDFGDSAILFTAILYTNNFARQSLVRHEFIKALTERYRAENIDMPYPMRTILRGD